jgi:hypothetical protein
MTQMRHCKHDSCVLTHIRIASREVSSQGYRSSHDAFMRHCSKVDELKQT